MSCHIPPFDARKFEYHFPTVITAKLTIADDLAIPSDENRAFIDGILAETLNRSEYWLASETRENAGSMEKIRP